MEKECLICGELFIDYSMLGGSDHDYCPNCEQEIWDSMVKDLIEQGFKEGYYELYS